MVWVGGWSGAGWVCGGVGWVQFLLQHPDNLQHQLLLNLFVCTWTLRYAVTTCYTYFALLAAHQHRGLPGVQPREGVKLRNGGGEGIRITRIHSICQRLLLGWRRASQEVRG